jgi:bacillopeptidase F (M6 metalloprotease family)
MAKSIRTNWVVIALGILVSVVILTTSRSVMAEGGDDGEADAPADASLHKSTFARERVNKGENKETDGTTAANRFKAETVIQSQYKLDGEQLEVDPD